MDKDKLVQAFEESLVKMIREGALLQPDYANRIKIDAAFVKEVYNQIDFNGVMAKLKPMLEERCAELILAAMATEITSDVKQLLSHKERREMLRSIVRENMDRLMSHDR